MSLEVGALSLEVGLEVGTLGLGVGALSLEVGLEVGALGLGVGALNLEVGLGVGALSLELSEHGIKYLVGPHIIVAVVVAAVVVKSRFLVSRHIGYLLWVVGGLCFVLFGLFCTKVHTN